MDKKEEDELLEELISVFEELRTTLKQNIDESIEIVTDILKEKKNE